MQSNSQAIFGLVVEFYNPIFGALYWTAVFKSFLHISFFMVTLRPEDSKIQLILVNLCNILSSLVAL